MQPARITKIVPDGHAVLTPDVGRELTFGPDNLLGPAHFNDLFEGQEVWFARGQVHGPTPSALLVSISAPKTPARDTLDYTEADHETLERLLLGDE